MQALFQAEDYPNLLVGLRVSDDAAVYKISDELAIVQTLDFFTPIVDDPYDYGAIAAANALSDIYAMGGEVVLALNVFCFPKDMPTEVASEILRGGGEKVREAGGVLAGGHTVDDKEPKYGLSVMGTVHPDRIFTKGGAKPGDILLLTKPLGVGVINTAAKAQLAAEEHIAEATESMKRLNKQAAQAIRRVGVHAVTDITGFALLGHSWEMAEKGNIGLEFEFSKLPFISGAIQYADDMLFPGGACRNENFYTKHVTFDESISAEMRTLLFTPETSGGLLIAVAPDRANALAKALDEEGQSFWVVGSAYKGCGVRVIP